MRPELLFLILFILLLVLLSCAKPGGLHHYQQRSDWGCAVHDEKLICP
jgi:hypothetical protein